MQRSPPFPPPPPKDSDADSLVSSYQLILSPPTQLQSDLGSLTNSLLIDAALWLFSNLIDELLIFADKIFEESEEKEQLMNNLWTEWTLLIGEEGTDRTRRSENGGGRFCRIYRFAIFLINILWLEMGKDVGNRQRLIKFLENNRWSDIVGFEIEIRK